MKTATQLRQDRQALKADMENAYARAATMLRCGDLAGWRDWSNEACRLGEQLAEATENARKIAARIFLALLVAVAAVCGADAGFLGLQVALSDDDED